MVVILLLTPSSNQNGCDDAAEQYRSKTILTTIRVPTERPIHDNQQYQERIQFWDKCNQDIDGNFCVDHKITNLQYEQSSTPNDRPIQTSYVNLPSVSNTLIKPSNSNFTNLELLLQQNECSTKPSISSQEKYTYRSSKLSPQGHLPNFKTISNNSNKKNYKTNGQQITRSCNSKSHNVTFDVDHLPNFVPKPPRQKNQQLFSYKDKPNANDLSKFYSNNNKYDNNFNKIQNDGKTKEYVRHVTRINFYDSESSQVDLNSDDNDNDAKPITKEEEWITKKKTELTTTRQIETRVKRQVFLEDGKVVDDSGPMVSTNTTEDTDKKESETTERINFGSPDSSNQLKIQDKISEPFNNSKVLNKPRRKKWSKAEPCIVLQTEEINDENLQLTPRREDGLVRESDDKHVISHEEIEERLETEDVRHLGDFSDETYVKAVNSGAENIEELLYSDENQKQLVPLGSRIVHQSTKSHKIVDTEDINQKSLAKPDGTLVTEKKKTTEHEELYDKDTPDKENLSGGSEINAIESSQRFFKQRDEQNVEYIADGKVIAKEMRYAAETEQMERDGPHEGPNDWDSLSDRIRKTRRNNKTILQHQKEAALLADRKDALTKRPLNFDREEETRKGETMKWLESHFGSESTASSDSRDGDHDSDLMEPSKKSYFNVTIKSNHAPPVTTQNGFENYQSSNGRTNGKHLNGALSFTSKVLVPQKNAILTNGKTKYFQGISNWSDRKESNSKHFASKAFKDELQGTVERNKLKHVSREDLRFIKSLKSEDNKRENTIQHRKYQYGSKNDLKYHKENSRDDSEDSRNIRLQREDLSLRGDPTKIRKSSNEDRNLYNLKMTNPRLKREDSGYVKDSHEDIRSSTLKDIDDECAANYRQPIMPRDDSAYVSSSNFTDSRGAKIPQLRTPDSGIRSPSPEPYDTSTGGNFYSQRPTVPLRKRAIEKRLKPQTKPLYSSNQYRDRESSRHRDEPPPDYSPPPRSRSISPTIHFHQEIKHPLSSGTENVNNHLISNVVAKQLPHARFEHDSTIYNRNNLSQNSSASTLRPTVSTQTSPQPKQSTKVGQAIGNSFKKLVGKIRSASAERKLKIKSKNKGRERSPSPVNRNKSLPNESTYQQYNVIDSHIGETINDNVTGSGYGNDGSFSKNNFSKNSQNQFQSRNSFNRESSFASSSATNGLKELRSGISGTGNNLERLYSTNSFEKCVPDSYDIDMLPSPKQRYYLGEDPYGNSIFGKENKYNRNNEGSRGDCLGIQNVHPRKGVIGINGEELKETFGQRNKTSFTLGRYQKSNQRHLGSTPNLDYDSRTAQTLPRKLEHRPSHHSSSINVSIVNQLKPTHNTGPAKPARTYKTLNRSKSFNVHGMNGTNDPSPIYLEKLTKNNYAGNIYKSNPHLNETGPQLKSPSIVNLISRSQKDLSRLHINDDSEGKYSSSYLSNNTQNLIKPTSYNNGNTNSKREMFLKELHDHAPELCRTLENENDVIQTVVHGNNRLYKYSDSRNQHQLPLDSKSSSVELIKDTASILRRGSSSTEEFSEAHNFVPKIDPLNIKNANIANIKEGSSKTNVSNKDTRGFQTVNCYENELITSSRYRNDSSLKSKEHYGRPNSSGGTTIIEVKGGKLKK